MTLVLREMDVARANPKPWPGWTHPPAGGGRQLSGGQLKVISVPVDDVHQAPITSGIGGWWMTRGQGKRRHRLRKCQTQAPMIYWSLFPPAPDSLPLVTALTAVYCVGQCGAGVG